jgi:hypothetical protein
LSSTPPKIPQKISLANLRADAYILSYGRLRNKAAVAAKGPDHWTTLPFWLLAAPTPSLYHSITLAAPTRPAKALWRRRKPCGGGSTPKERATLCQNNVFYHPCAATGSFCAHFLSAKASETADAANQRKCLSMNNLYTKMSFPNQKPSNQIKPNQSTFFEPSCPSLPHDQTLGTKSSDLRPAAFCAFGAA